MVDFYVKNGTGGTDDGSSWANAAEGIKVICDGGGYQALAAGDTIYVDEGHQESYAASTAFPFPAVVSNPVRVIVVSTGTTNAVTSTTSTLTITTTTSNDNINFSGAAYFWGIRVSTQEDYSLSITNTYIVFEESSVESHTNDTVFDGADATTLILINTNVKDLVFTTHLGMMVLWLGGAWVSTGIIASTELIQTAAEGGQVHIRDVDLSDFDGTYVIAGTAGNDQFVRVHLERCKMWSGFVAVNGTIGLTNSIPTLLMESCDTADGYSYFNYNYYQGSVVQDTGIYRTGGNDFTAKIAALATGPVNYISPIRHKLVSQYIDIATEKTITAHFTYDDATVLNDDDMWLEIEYGDATDEALGILADTKAATPTTTPGRTPFTDVSGAETWNGTGGFSNPQEETLEKAITGAAGIITVWVCLAKPSTTVYVDPDVTVS